MPHDLVANRVNLTHGRCIRVKGTVAQNPKCFVVNLGQDEKNLSLHINPRFNYLGYVRKVVYNSRKAGSWEKELRDSDFPFQPGTVTEIGITFEKAELTVKMPDGHTYKFPNRHNVDIIDYLGVHGDFKVQCLTFE